VEEVALVELAEHKKEQWPTLATCCANAGLRQTNPPPNTPHLVPEKHALREIKSILVIRLIRN